MLPTCINDTSSAGQGQMPPPMLAVTGYWLSQA